MSEVYKGIKSILTAYWTKVKNYIDTKLSGKANSSHTHDDRYFTETEVTNKLAGKSDTGHTHTKSQITDFPAIPSVGNGTVTIKQAGTSKGTFTMNQSGNTTIELTDSNTTYSNKTAAQNGTDVSLVTTGEKYTWNSKAAGNHTHTSVIDNGNKSNATTFAYSKAGLDTTNWFAAWNGYELRAISPAKTLSTIGAAAASHTHTKSQITDFPTSLPANGGTADTATTAYKIRIGNSNPSDGDIWIQ